MKFYEDPVFIEMMRKAEEIQAQKPYGIVNALFSAGYAISDAGDFYTCRKRDFGTWLPRLDQLIEMLGGVGFTWYSDDEALYIAGESFHDQPLCTRDI